MNQQTVSNEDIEQVGLSLARCCEQNGFFDRFYELFLKADPRIKPMFDNTDFNKQNRVLKAGIANLILFAQQSDFGKSKVAELGFTHNVNNLNIKPEYYGIWVDSLLKAISEFDSKHTEELAASWTKVLRLGIEKIISAYNS